MINVHTHHHIIARPFGGTNTDLNRKEYLLARVMEHTLEQIARSVDVHADSMRDALDGFDYMRRSVTGAAFRKQIEHYTMLTFQSGVTNADTLIHKRSHKKRQSAAIVFTAPKPGIIPMTKWGTIINKLTVHTVDHFDRIADDFKDRLKDTLKDGYKNGESIPDLAGRVQDALGIDKNRAIERARTMTMETYNQAHLYQYSEVGIPGVQVLAQPDERECFPKNTMIKTDKGDHPIQDICIGDRVLTRMGFQRVKGTTKREYSGVLIEVKTMEGKFICTSNHPIYVIGKGWLRADNLYMGDFLQTFENHPTKIIGLNNISLSYSDNKPTVTDKVSIFSSIFRRITMPVFPISFKSNLTIFSVKTLLRTIFCFIQSSHERLSAGRTDFCNSHQSIQGSITVYNLSVEGAPEYYANGYLVHNCDYCADLDGCVFALDDPDLIYPPYHNFCRCTILPYLDPIPDDAKQPSADTVSFVNDWVDNYFDIPCYALGEE